MNKKVLISVLTVVAAFSLRAQTPHNPPLDTIVGYEITYFYNNEDGVAECPDFWYATVGTKWEAASRFYTDTTLRVIGIAICGHGIPSMAYDSTNMSLYYYSDSVVRLKIYEAGDSVLIPLASGVANMNETDRWMEVSGFYRGEIYFGHSRNPWPGNGDWIVPVTEIYFDSAVTVEDSFYVGFAPIHPNKDLFFVYYQLLWGNSSFCPFVGMAEYDIETYRWRYGPLNDNFFMFPIIDSVGWSMYCDTLVCPVVEELNVSAGYGMAVCSWLGDTLSGHSKWQLSYGPVGTEPEDGQVITTTALSRVLNGLEDTVEYVVYVRGYCTVCRKWGEWSEGKVFRLLDSEGIQSAEVERSVSVLPNPSHGRVEVTSSCSMQRVTVYDAQGVQVLTQKTSDKTAVIDLSGRPAGLYFVTVYTTTGVVCRKLLLE